MMQFSRDVNIPIDVNTIRMMFPQFDNQVKDGGISKSEFKVKLKQIVGMR